MFTPSPLLLPPPLPSSYAPGAIFKSCGFDPTALQTTTWTKARSAYSKIKGFLPTLPSAMTFVKLDDVEMAIEKTAAQEMSVSDRLAAIEVKIDKALKQVARSA